MNDASPLPSPSPYDLSGIELELPQELVAGSKLQFITCQVEGLVEAADLRLLVEAPKGQSGGAEPGDLKKLREKHHSVARLIASGMPQVTVAAITGYTESYLSILLNNPSMQELIAHYRSNHTAAAEVIGERLRSAGLGALEKLQEKMDDPEQGLEDQVLLGLAKLGLDRSGHGPQSKVTQVTEHHLIDHAELRRLNRAAREASREDIITDLTALPAPALTAEQQASVDEAIDATFEELVAGNGAEDQEPGA